MPSLGSERSAERFGLGGAIVLPGASSLLSVADQAAVSEHRWAQGLLIHPDRLKQILVPNK